MLNEIFDTEKSDVYNGKVEAKSYSPDPIRILQYISLTFSLIFVAFLLVWLHCGSSRVSRTMNDKTSTHLYSAVMLETIARISHAMLEVIEGLHIFNWNSSSDFDTVCKILIFVTEYSICAFFMWLFLLSYYLAVDGLSGQVHTYRFLVYCLMAWGIPAISTIIWVVALSLSYKTTCWIGYKYQPIVWILECFKIILILATLFNSILSVRRLLQKCKLHKHTAFFQRIVRDNVICVSTVIFSVVSMTLVYLHAYGYKRETENEVLTTLSTFLVSLKGTVLVCIFIAVRADIRRLIPLKFRPAVQRFVPGLTSESRMQSEVCHNEHSEDPVCML